MDRFRKNRFLGYEKESLKRLSFKFKKKVLSFKSLKISISKN